MVTSRNRARSPSLTMRVTVGALMMSGFVRAAPEGPSTPERVHARTLYAQGEKLFKAGDYEGAEHAFADAYQTMPNAIVLLKVADAQTKREDFQAAVTTLEKYLSERANAPDRSSIQDRIAEMRKKPGTVTLKSSPAGAAIWVDGADTALVTPSDVALSPGEHKFALKLPPYQDAEQSVVVEFAAKSTVELALAPPTPVAPPPVEGLPNTTSVPEQDHSPGRHLTAPFWVAVGVTAAGAVVTTAFGIVALNKHSQFERTPTNQLADDGERAATISDIALGVGVAGAVTATVLFFTAPHGERPPATSFSLAPLVGTRGGGLVGNASF
jgi:hypothetical protein